ncbi:BlaI/MecI/CopY family transcriptional regulator [Frankia sp. CNm7]|uniref:BlaI/MecI/CopY family transcriptional regulator n=2 Tax=Frankia nepalensis TaxID=1836974 RepID=A0A937UPP4_9ACTN|nr:BlaI/MecI/CopY family transcriptional regulator [Frankia nepalensis]MBL7498025.1 BlaI/MecI/CopY family transcriptional regulator [Frankia nepalensis]MBL7515403.1 BlaI/MecI/CopY family transcriptional regulator [Frankia nepalensis]MBL7523092.1 BlaI/MecI/CopY family transcriptional regulator [Frankia nepalensis]MBL7629327.1 BlaI/MecI/CopY family transcriptional regulator [Frankia nepalensis]
MDRERRPPGDLERSVMDELQTAGRPLTPREVLARLEGDLAYTTVMTILFRLHAKGLLKRERTGRAFAYRPVADEPGLAVRRIHQILDEGPDREVVLSRFLGSLSKRDEQVLRRMLDDLDTRPARPRARPPEE